MRSLRSAKMLAQGPEVRAGSRFFEGTPFHKAARLSQLIRLELYIPGNFIPASLRAKLALPICLNILRIWAYWRSKLLTSCTLVPEPREMRLRRLPLITSWCWRSCDGHRIDDGLDAIDLLFVDFVRVLFAIRRTDRCWAACP